MGEIITYNPTTEEPLENYAVMSDRDVIDKIEDSHAVWLNWKASSWKIRKSFMLKMAEILRERKSELAISMSTEMGKITGEAEAEIEKSAWVCDYYANNAREFLVNKNISTEARKSYVSYQPLGVILAIMPWNFPFWQVYRFAAPNLMAGNAVILKHAPNVTGCALLIEELFSNAGFPKGLFKTVIIEIDQVNAMIDHTAVQGVTLTGSTGAGRAVAERCGRSLKKCVLELGGNDPYVILKDANLEMAVEVCLSSRMMNAGQSCIAAKRLIVVEEVMEEFEAMMTKKLGALTFGEPDSGADLGPMARSDLRDNLHKQVEESIASGAVCLLGGFIPGRTGYFYPPTLLKNVKPGMPAFNEELFGPVVSLISAKNENDALRLANDTAYGLGSAVFTRDLEKGMHISEHKLESGSAFVNQMVKSDPRLPFGGIKNSGIGRELGLHGIFEFVNIKTISMA